MKLEYPYKQYEGRLAINVLGSITKEKGNLYLFQKFTGTMPSLKSNPAFAIFKCKVFDIHSKRVYEDDNVHFLISNFGYKWLTNNLAQEFIRSIFE